MSEPVEPMVPRRTPMPWREVFGWRFWVNYLLCLVVTLWVPIVEMGVVVNGEVQQRQRQAAYRVYQQLFEDPTLWIAWKYVFAHWGIVFVVMATVWWFVLRRMGVGNEVDNA